MIIAGVDEAGRGPVIGPLVIAGVIMESGKLSALVENGLTDSKLLSKKKRVELFEQIKQEALDTHIEIIRAEDIDKQFACSINLNQIEKNAIVEILSTLTNWTKAYVDACDVDAKRFELALQKEVKQQNICAEHSADLKYPIVSAASILAKVTRDKIIEELHLKFGTNFGSGYPSDPKTCAFIRDYFTAHKKMPKIVRDCWATSKKIKAEVNQQKLEQYFS